MPKYVEYTPGATEPTLAHWFDTDFADYPNLPSEDSLRELDDTEWAGRMNTPYVDGDGNLTSSPPPTLRQQADNEIANRITSGIAVTSTGTPAANATYAIDDRSYATIGAYARDIASGLGLPVTDVPAPGMPRGPRDAPSTVWYPDIDGNPILLTSDQVSGLYIVIRDLRSTLDYQGGVMAAGGDPVWPDQTGVIP